MSIHFSYERLDEEYDEYFEVCQMDFNVGALWREGIVAQGGKMVPWMNVALTAVPGG